MSNENKNSKQDTIIKILSLLTVIGKFLDMLIHFIQHF